MKKNKYAFKSSRHRHGKSNDLKSIKFYLKRAKLQVCKDRHVKEQPGKVCNFWHRMDHYILYIIYCILCIIMYNI